MTHPPLFSVVTVCLNSQATMRDTFESVLVQDWGDFEYVVVDGGSTDGSLALIEDYARRFQSRGIVMTWCSESDCGIYDAMNKAVALARGEWIHFLGGDDFYYRRDALSQVAASLVAADAGINVLLSPVYQVDVDLRIHRVEHPLPAGFLPWGMWPHQGAFVRTALHRERPFDLGFRIAADYEFFLSLHRRGAIRDQRIDMPLVCFSTGGVSSTAGRLRQLEHLEIRARHGGLKDQLALLRKRYPWLRLLLWRIFFLSPRRHLPPKDDGAFVVPDFIIGQRGLAVRGRDGFQPK